MSAPRVGRFLVFDEEPNRYKRSLKPYLTTLVLGLTFLTSLSLYSFTLVLVVNKRSRDFTSGYTYNNYSRNGLLGPNDLTSPNRSLD